MVKSIPLENVTDCGVLRQATALGALLCGDILPKIYVDTASSSWPRELRNHGPADPRAARPSQKPRLPTADVVAHSKTLLLPRPSPSSNVKERQEIIDSI
mmetsp:Transcript_31195/g.100416  ORF Transcript_31195/g.100416 Transcript_31195/m.100416 type:complete len:100 (-) Transcript_31195:543-842(-)